MPLTDIMVNLERKYHVEIVLSSSLPANKRLSLVVQHEPLEDIMEVISFSLFVSNIIRINLSPLCSYINK